MSTPINNVAIMHLICAPRKSKDFKAPFCCEFLDLRTGDGLSPVLITSRSPSCRASESQCELTDLVDNNCQISSTRETRTGLSEVGRHSPHSGQPQNS